MRKSFPDASLSLLFAIIRKKKVRINGVVGKAAQIIKENDLIEIYENLPQIVEAVGARRALPYKENLNFILLNPDFAVLDKPCGLASQSGSGVREEECLVGQLHAWAMEQGMDFKPALVHRLDKETSGLIIAATTGPAVREFSDMIKNRKIKKEYLALVKGNMPQRTGKISAPLPGDTRISETSWVVEKSFGKCDLVRVNLETGRKHQIRIHFATAGHPLLGDSKHGDFALNREFKKSCGLSRLFLHATLLEFSWKGKKIKIESPLPKELLQIFSILL